MTVGGEFEALLLSPEFEKGEAIAESLSPDTRAHVRCRDELE
jgi:hypothetical protein